MKIWILDAYHDTLRTLACFGQIVAYAAGAPANVVNPAALKASR